MAGPGKRGRKRKVVVKQEHLQERSGGVQLVEHFSPSLPPPPPPPSQEDMAGHRYPTRCSFSVPREYASSAVSLRFPLQRGTPKQSSFTAKRVLLGAKKEPRPSSGEVQALEQCTTKPPHQNQVSTFPATSPDIDKNMKNALDPASTKDWSASRSGEEQDVNKLTMYLLSHKERPENFQRSLPLISNKRNGTGQHLQAAGDNLESNATNDIREKIGTSCHTPKDTQLSRCCVAVTEILQRCKNIDDDQEAESAARPPLVTVKVGYRVKEEVAPLLREIIAKYGDIAGECTMESETCAVFLQLICGLYKDLEQKKLGCITPTELKRMFGLVKDLEAMKFNVKWLHDRIKEISDANCYLDLKEERDRKLKLMEIKERELLGHQIKLDALQHQMTLWREELAEMKTNVEKLDNKVLEVRKKATAFCKNSLVHGLL